MLESFLLADSPTNMALWAHYGEKHQGFVIGFRTSDSFFNRRRSYKDDFYHLRRVRYLDRAKVKVSLVELDRSDILFTKGVDWSYEREWRMVVPLKNYTQHLSVEGDNIYLIPFPESVLCEIIVGARADDTLLKSLQAILASRPSCTHVTIRKAIIPTVGADMTIES